MCVCVGGGGAVYLFSLKKQSLEVLITISKALSLGISVFCFSFLSFLIVLHKLLVFFLSSFTQVTFLILSKRISFLPGTVKH